MDIAAADDADDFVPMADEADDESTLAAAEAEQGADSSSHAAELAALKDEGEMPIEQLRAMYGYDVAPPAAAVGGGEETRRKRHSPRGNGAVPESIDDEKEDDMTSLLSRSPSRAASDSDHTADFVVAAILQASVG